MSLTIVLEGSSVVQNLLFENHNSITDCTIFLISSMRSKSLNNILAETNWTACKFSHLKYLLWKRRFQLCTLCYNSKILNMVESLSSAERHLHCHATIYSSKSVSPTVFHKPWSFIRRYFLEEVDLVFSKSAPFMGGKMNMP